MIEIPVLNTEGKPVGSEKLDPAQFGGHVRFELLKQAIVTYQANRRQGSAATRSRGQVQGSSRKIYRQKGTGRARAGNIRTPVRVGGGRTFAKSARSFSLKLPRKMRRLARASAFLAKAESGTAMIVDGLSFDAPKTSRMAAVLKAVKVERGALLTVASRDENLFKSIRNIPNVEMKLIGEVNAFDVIRARHLVFTRDAFKALSADPMAQACSAEA